MILPPATLGMLGGGQLASLFPQPMKWAIAGLGARPGQEFPAAQIAERHFCVAYGKRGAGHRPGLCGDHHRIRDAPADTLDYLAKFVPGAPACGGGGGLPASRCGKDFLRDNEFRMAPCGHE